MTQIFYSRNIKRGDPPPVIKEIHDDGVAMKRDIQATGVSDRMVVVFSSLFGEQASDTNSFTRRLVR